MEYEIYSSYALDQFILDESQKILFIEFRIENQNIKKTIEKIFLFQKNTNKIPFSYAQINQKKIFDFDSIYELDETSCILFFYKNKKINVDINSGDNNKLLNKNTSTKYLSNLLSRINLAVKKGVFFVNF